MEDSKLIIESLRNHLRSHGVTYKKLALHWQLSESSVKRIMSADDVSLKKIESACQLIALPVSEFFRNVQFLHNQDFIYMTLKQEESLAKEPKLLHFFMLLQEGWTPSKIVQKYSLTNIETTKFLVQLDKLKIIELLPRGRVKKLLDGQLRFLKDGPIGKQLKILAKGQFLESEFKNENEYLTFLNLKLTHTDVLKLKNQLIQMSKELTVLSEHRHSHPNTQEFGLIVGLRPWSAPFMHVLQKRQTKKV